MSIGVAHPPPDLIRATLVVRKPSRTHRGESADSDDEVELALSGASTASDSLPATPSAQPKGSYAVSISPRYQSDLVDLEALSRCLFSYTVSRVVRN